MRLLTVVFALLASACSASASVVDELAAPEITSVPTVTTAPTAEPQPTPLPTPTATPAPRPTPAKWVVVTRPTPLPSATPSSVVEVEPTATVIEVAPTPNTAPPVSPVSPVSPESFAAGYGVGACYTDTGWQSGEATPCSDAHIAEALFAGELVFSAGADFPGEDVMIDLVHQACLPSLDDAWRAIVDTSLARSAPFWPTAEEWSEGDRGFVCFVAFDEPVDLSVAAMGELRPKLETGRCYLNDQLDAAAPEAIACTELHHVEIYHIGQFNDPAGAPFPGGEALAERAKPTCRQAFQAQTGVPLVHAMLEKVTLLPIQTWHTGNRSFHCFIRFSEMTNLSLAQIDPLRYGSRDSLFGITPGECLVSSEIATADRSFVDCAEPHNFQVLAVFELSAGAYPGDTVVAEDARGRCQDAAAAGGYLASSVDWTLNIVTPHEPGWTNPGGRVAVCFADSPQMVTTSIFG